MDKLTLLPYGLTGNIYRSPLPNSTMFDAEKEVLAAYKQAGVKWVVALVPDGEVLEHAGMHLHDLYRPLGIEVINNPVEDFTAPSHGAFDTATRMVINMAKRGKTIAIHCHAGVGRTGMFAACLARELWGWDGDKAIAWVREYIPGAVESDFQVEFVREYKEIQEKPHYPQSVKL